MLLVTFYEGFSFKPILAIVFCLNLVSIIKAIHAGEPTRLHTFWLTTSLGAITWSIALRNLCFVY